MRRYPFFTLILFLLISCSNNEEELLSTISNLEKKVTDLENQLENCKNGPSRILTEIKGEFERENYLGVISLFRKMESEHAGTPEFNEAREIYNEVLEISEKNKKESQRKAEAENREKLKSLNKLNKKFDDVAGIYWYQNPYFTHYNNSNLTSIYIGEQGSQVWLRLKMSYNGDDWIFFEKAYLSYGGDTREISFDKYQDKKTDNSGGEVWEWIDVSVSGYLIPYLRQLANSSDAKMRLSGKYSKTRNLSQNERRAILDVLDGYEALKNSK